MEYLIIIQNLLTNQGLQCQGRCRQSRRIGAESLRHWTSEWDERSRRRARTTDSNSKYSHFIWCPPDGASRGHDTWRAVCCCVLCQAAHVLCCAVAPTAHPWEWLCKPMGSSLIIITPNFQPKKLTTDVFTCSYRSYNKERWRRQKELKAEQRAAEDRQDEKMRNISGKSEPRRLKNKIEDLEKQVRELKEMLDA